MKKTVNINSQTKVFKNCKEESASAGTETLPPSSSHSHWSHQPTARCETHQTREPSSTSSWFRSCEPKPTWAFSPSEPQSGKVSSQEHQTWSPAILRTWLTLRLETEESPGTFSRSSLAVRKRLLVILLVMARINTGVILVPTPLSPRTFLGAASGWG